MIGMCKDDTRIGRSISNDMRQVEIDAMDIRVFGSDQVNVYSKTTTNIHHSFYALKTFVGLQNLLHNQRGVDHCCVENFIEPWIQTCILKSMSAMNPVEWNTPLPNCIFQLTPIIIYKQSTSTIQKYVKSLKI